MLKHQASFLNKAVRRAAASRHHATMSHELSTTQDFYGTSIEPILAPISSVTDILGNTLKSTAVLRMGMHHLHANADRFIPYTNPDDLILHCVSQACITFPVDNLMDKVQHEKEQVSFGDYTVGVTPIISDLWVQSLGRTSITFGHAVTFQDELLALVSRVFVRQDAKTGALIHITEDERTEQFPASYEEVGLPTAEKLTRTDHTKMEEVFQVRIGQQHCNEYSVDPSALVEIALQGLSLRGHTPYSQKMSCQHLSPPQMHETLSCRVHSNKPVVGLYRTSLSGKDELLVLATMEVNYK